MARDFTSIIIGIIAMVILGLIGLYFYNAFAGKTVASASTPVFLLIIGFILTAIFFFIKSTAAGSTLNIGGLAALVAAGILIYLIIQFPQLVPTSFSVAGQRAAGMLPAGILFFRPKEAGNER